MFRPRNLHPRYTDPLNWTDYRWETGPWHRGVAAPLRGHRRRRGHPMALLLVAGLAALLIPKLLPTVQSRSGSWLRRALYALVLLTIMGAFSRGRRRW